MATTTRDDAFHEIQLNGKQLFFLFMAATVVSVVIFLCGVLVGRGVRTERSATAENEALSSSPSADAPPAVVPAPVTPAEPATTDLTIVPPPPAAEENATTLDEVKPNRASVKSAEPAPKADAPPKAAAATSAPPKTTATPPPPAGKPPAPAPVAAAATPPAKAPDGGWAVQVAAVNSRPDADAVVKALGAKGYDAYILGPQSGRVTYRVRIGSFKTKPEADALADKLKKQGQSSWVTR